MHFKKFEWCRGAEALELQKLIANSGEIHFLVLGEIYPNQMLSICITFRIL
jgi:hypothetical protein